MQASVFSDFFSRVESRFNHFRSITDDPSARVAAISVFVKEIDVTWKQLRSLRNALAPISFLPPEVLAQVFHFLWLEDPPRFEEHYSGCIRATHVCRLWRRVALGDSLLWTRIADTLNNTGWVSEMLTRARNAPLNIDIKHGLKRGPKWFFMLSPHLSRTRKLRINFFAWHPASLAA